MPRQQQVPKPTGSLAVRQTQARAEAAGRAHIHTPLLELQNPPFMAGPLATQTQATPPSLPCSSP